MLLSSGANGRKLTRKGQGTRDRIVAAAAALIQERGVAGTSTEDVREAAGVSSSQLYHYFRDKMSLVRAVIAYLTDAVLGAQADFLGDLDSIAALRQWRDLLVRIQRGLHCEGGCPLGTLASQLAETAPTARLDLELAFAWWEEGIGSGLRAMHDRGELRRDVDPAKLATALLGAVQGGLILTQVRRDTAPLEASVDTMLDYIESLTR
ncbi:MAG TPA: TetR/AcrR family transcriptional regulator [Candidatus Baltobacteraceae bacterium]|nr:TetR/AcrR family transcriptional regulator [Candidatus Baltobacteraceae bacterium]